MGSLPSVRLLMVAAAVCIGGSFHHGFQTVVTSPAQKALMAFVNSSYYEHYGWGLSHATTMWSVTVAVLSVGAIFGSLSISFVATKLGRKRGLYVPIALEIIGAFLALLSYHAFAFELYIVSRIVIGYAISINMGLAAMFLNESSLLQLKAIIRFNPKRCRGFINMMSCQFVTMGTVFAAVIALPSVLGTIVNWWYIYLIESLILIPILVLLTFVPESHGYLLASGKEEEALRAIQFFHKCSLNEAEGVLSEIRDNMKLLVKSMSFSAVFKDKYSREGVLVGIVVSCSMSFCGASAVNAFAVALLTNVGLSAQNAAFANIGLMAILVVFSTTASFIVDRYGRRPLILISAIGLTICNTVLAILMYCFNRYQFAWAGYCMIVVIALTKLFSVTGIAPLSFFIASEIRTITISLFLPLIEAIGDYLAFTILFVFPLLCGTIYLYFKMPETKNRNHKELIEAMKKLPSLSKYICWRRENE